MTPPRPTCLLALLLTGLLAMTPALLHAQPFTRIVDGPVGTAESLNRGATYVDYDDDGDLDLFVPSWLSPALLPGFPNLLYRNDGGGTFTQRMGGPLVNDDAGASAACWADYDNDGDRDVYVAGELPGSILYENQGGGHFARVETGAIGDFAANRGWSCAWGDYDNDGYVDLFVAHPEGFVRGGPPISNRLLRNNGNGTFTPVTDTPITDGLAAYTVGNWTDFDQDGDLDLFIGSGPVTGTPAPDFLYRNLLAETGTASFERITELPLNQPRDGQQWNFVDYDNDGDFDAYVTNFSGFADDFYRNDDGTFVEVTDSPLVERTVNSLANVWEDFDNDGDLDVFVATGGGTGNAYYENSGAPDYTFTRTGSFSTDTAITWGATAGDQDNDGDIDLFVATVLPTAFGGSPNLLYRNDLAAGNAWVRVRSVGTASNAAGIGVKMRVTANLGGTSTTQLREVSTQDAFNGHTALDVHFGLGNADRVDELRIEWPSGAVDVASGVAPNTFYAAVEGRGLVPMSAFLAETLLARVEGLQASGVLNAGQARALSAKLNAAIEKIEAGTPTPASNMLGAFLNQVDAFEQEGVLTEAQARALRDPGATARRFLDAGMATAMAKTVSATEKAHASLDVPQAFGLESNYPNPFSTSTSIRFALPAAGPVSLEVYDLQGRLVATLVDAAREAGHHTVRWSPGTVPSGVYLYRLRAGGTMRARVMHLVR